jgi:hypothetical protein
MIVDLCWNFDDHQISPSESRVQDTFPITTSSILDHEREQQQIGIMKRFKSHTHISSTHEKNLCERRSTAIITSKFLVF